jgi:hypothetical protein
MSVYNGPSITTSGLIFDMDVIKISRSYGLTSEYQYTPDGKLYIKTNVSMSKEERKQAKKGEHTSYSILNIVDVETSETDLYTIKYDGMNVFNKRRYFFVKTHNLKMYVNM